MELLSSAIFLLLWVSNLARRIQFPELPDVTYEELEKLDAVCPNQDNCKNPRSSDTLLKYTCHCESFCSDLGTCCIDSPYRAKLPAVEPTQRCKTVFGRDSSSYFMVDSCPSRGNDENWRKLCRDGDYNDLMTCHESEVAPHRYWNIKLFSNQKINEEVNEYTSVTYDAVNGTWMAAIGQGVTPVPVFLGLEIPTDVKNLPKLCVLNVISNCPAKWQDVDTRHKCHVYTSIVYIRNRGRFRSYRNPHCAFCNFEDLEKMLCSFNSMVRTSKRPFSFSHLLDINRSDGDQVGKIQQCNDDSVWDPFFKKCRVLKCALPGFVVRDGKCSRS